MEMAKPAKASGKPQWQRIVQQYQGSDTRQSIVQLVTSVVPYFALWYLMYLSLSYSYAITLVLSIFASGFLLRSFIIFHDCTHGSFFNSRKANDVVGVFTGLLSFTPYAAWRHRHALHHATTGNLDRRGWWDIEVYTVKEFEALPKWEQIRYRLYRHPFILFVMGSTVFFLLLQRIPRRDSKKAELTSIMWTNVALVVLVAAMCYLVGWREFIMIQLPIAFLSSTVGLWMFYVQHQFEQAYWEHSDEWDYLTASLKGSSYYKLPRVLQWFTGNIGFHHIHHLSAKIPNYRLEQCFNDNELFQDVTTITLKTSLEAFDAKLWDEDRKLMIGFGTYDRMKRQQVVGA